jgi:hypothetical protein
MTLVYTAHETYESIPGLLNKIVFFHQTPGRELVSLKLYLYIIFLNMITMVGKSRGNKQADKNAAKEKSSDSSKHKKKAQKKHNLGGGGARGKSKRQQ